MIPNYFKRLNSNEAHDENQNKVRKLSDNKTDDQTRVPVTCFLKTVKKWMTELNIDLATSWRIKMARRLTLSVKCGARCVECILLTVLPP